MVPSKDPDAEPESRRDFLRLTSGVAGASMIGGMAGCLGGADGDGGGGDGSGADGDGGDGSGNGGDGGDMEPQYAEELFYWAVGTTNPEDWSGFKEETSTSVRYSEAAWNMGETLNKMVQGTAATDFDVAANGLSLTPVLDEQGAIFPTDLESLSNWEHVYDELKGTWWAEVDGKQHSLSSVQNGDSVAYLTDHVGDPGSVNSYGILFDREFKGKTSIEASWGTAYHKIALYLKHNNLADIQDVRDPAESDIDAVVDFLLKEKEEGQFRTFWNGWQSAVSLLAREEVWAMDTWEPVVFALRDEGLNAEYLWPNEGFSLWSIGPWMTKGGREKEDTVNALVNWMMDGWYNAQITSIRGYLTSSELGIEYAKESDDYDADFIAELHDRVREKFRMEESVFGNRYPETFGYLNEQWDRLTS